MTAGEEWDAISADPEFRAQPSTEQNRIALSFFTKRIAPQVPPEQQDAVRGQFFADAFKAPAAAPQPGMGEMALQAGKETLKAPVPGLARVADAVRTDIPEAIAGAGERVGLPKTGAAIGAAVGTAGELIPKTGGELALAGLGGPVIKGAGAFGAKAAPTVVSKLTGKSLPDAQRTIARAAQLMNPTLLKPETEAKGVEAIGAGIKAARTALGRRLGLAEDAAIARAPGRVLQVRGIGDELAQKFQRAGIAADGVAIGDHANPINPKLQSIIDRFRNIQAATPESPILDRFGVPLPGKPPMPRDMALRDALNLKKDIYEMAYDKPDNLKLLGVGEKETSFLKDAARNLDEHIRTGAAADPALNAATDRFARMGKAYNRLERTALSGQVDTVQKRLGKIFAAGDIERKVGTELGDIGAGRAALDTVLDAKSAKTSAPWINPRLSRAFENTGGGVLGNTLKIFGVGAGASMAPGSVAQKAALGAATMAATSPRLINSAIRAAVVPIGQSKAVEAAASPVSRALVASPLMRRLQNNKEQK